MDLSTSLGVASVSLCVAATLLSKNFGGTKNRRGFQSHGVLDTKYTYEEIGVGFRGRPLNGIFMNIPMKWMIYFMEEGLPFAWMMTGGPMEKSQL